MVEILAGLAGFAVAAEAAVEIKFASLHHGIRNVVLRRNLNTSGASANRGVYRDAHECPFPSWRRGITLYACETQAEISDRGDGKDHEGRDEAQEKSFHFCAPAFSSRPACTRGGRLVIWEMNPASSQSF